MNKKILGLFGFIFLFALSIPVLTQAFAYYNNSYTFLRAPYYQMSINPAGPWTSYVVSSPSSNQTPYEPGSVINISGSVSDNQPYPGPFPRTGSIQVSIPACGYYTTIPLGGTRSFSCNWTVPSNFTTPGDLAFIPGDMVITGQWDSYFDGVYSHVDSYNVPLPFIYSHRIIDRIIAGPVTPPPPTGLNVNSSACEKIDLSWNPIPPPPTGPAYLYYYPTPYYKIYRSSTSNGPYTYIAATQTTTQYTDNVSGSYYYKISGVYGAPIVITPNTESTLTSAVNGSAISCKGSVKITRYGSDLASPSTAPEGTHGKLDSPTEITTNPSDFTNIGVGGHTAYSTDVSGYTVTMGTCTYDIGATECDIPASAFTTVPSCNEGFCQTAVFVAAGKVTKLGVKYTIIPEIAGSIRVTRVGYDGMIQSVPPGTLGWVDALTASSSNPADYNHLAVSPYHEVFATNLTDYTETMGTCTYPIGGTECNVDNFSSYPDPVCIPSSCRFFIDLPVTADMVTKVGVKYTSNLPPTPQGLTVATGASCGNKVTVSWGLSVGATSYRLFRSSTPGGTETELTNISIGPNSASLLDVTPSAQTTYYYRVSAVNQAGESAKSTAVSGSSSVQCTPTVVTGSTCGNKVTISWPLTPGATGYKLYRSTSANGTYTVLPNPSVGPVSASLLDVTPNPATTYYYKFSVISPTGESDMSPYASAVSSSACPTAPNTPTLSVGTSATCGNKISLSWTASTGATGYRVYRYNATTGLYGEITPTNGTTSLSMIDITPNPSTQYSYKVLAFNSTGSSAQSGAVQGTSSATCPTVPNTPTLNVNTSAVCGNKITLNWTASTGATGYHIYRSASQNGTYPLINTISSGTLTLTDVVPNPSTTYYYKIDAYNAVGSSTQSAVRASQSSPACPTSGSIRISRYGENGAWSPNTVPTGTKARWLDSAGVNILSSANPVDYAVVPQGANNIQATDVGYAVKVGSCTYPQPNASAGECSIPLNAFATTTCSAGICNIPAYVYTGQVTKVGLIYVPLPPACNSNAHLVNGACVCNNGATNYPTCTITQTCPTGTTGIYPNCVGGNLCPLNQQLDPITNTCVCNNGLGSQYINQGCLCPTGTVQSGNTCISCTGNQIVVNGSCQCPSGTVLNPASGLCESAPVQIILFSVNPNTVNYDNPCHVNIKVQGASSCTIAGDVNYILNQTNGGLDNTGYASTTIISGNVTSGTRFTATCLGLGANPASVSRIANCAVNPKPIEQH